MTSNSPANPANSNDPFFVTPDPSALQSEENQADMDEQVEDTDPNGPFHVVDEIGTDETALHDLEVIRQSEEDEVALGFDPDAIAQSGSDSTVSSSEQDVDRLRDRQIGTAFGSGS